MTTSGSFQIDYSDMSEVLSVLSAQTSSIESALETLNATLNKYIGDFVGATSEAFVTDQNNWNKAATQMQELLAQIQQGGQVIMENYAAADNRGASRFAL